MRSASSNSGKGAARLAWGVAAAIALGALGLVAALRTLGPSDERPEIYAIAGPQPGDLAPGLVDIEDNVRNYGLDVDLPYRFSTNSLGFRGPDPSGTGPLVLVLGDSFAFGMGVDDGATFSDYLVKVLGERVPGVRVLNAGVPGYTITDQLDQFRAKLRDLGPALVLVCHTSSDIKEMARPVSFRRLLGHDDEAEGRSDAGVQRLIDQAGGDKATAVRRYWTFTEEDLRRDAGRGEWPKLAELDERYVAGALALSRSAARVGAKVAFVFWAETYGLGGGDVTALETALAAVGVPSFRAARAMLASHGPDRKLYLPDDHFSPLGNEVTAKQVGEWLIETKLVDRASARRTAPTAP